MKRVYLDYAATTPTDPRVIEAMLPYFQDVWGNPSSVHACGQEARAAIEEVRERVADLIGAEKEEVYFTSGGTEADNTALKGIAFANGARGNHVITSPIEHHAILHTCDFLKQQGFDVTYVPVDGYGMVDPDEVKKAITSRTVLISIMHANNEVGTIQPIAEIGRVAREAGVYLHTDAVQTVGHVSVDVNEMRLDMLSISAHKFSGPKGIGAMYIRKGTKIEPFMHGGGQEMKTRAGTENVPGIIGLGKAVEMAQEEMAAEGARLTQLRDALIKGILGKIERTRLNGHPTQRLPNNVNISFEFVEGEAICLNLDLAGICVATGSACSSTSMEASHVLTAMGVSPEVARSSLRFSMGKWTTPADTQFVLETMPRVVGRLRAISPLAIKGQEKTP